MEAAATTMLPFKLIYSDDYYLPIGAHVFPAEKYRQIHDRLLETGIAEASDFVTPQPASDQDVLLVHTPAYVNKLKTGTLSAARRTGDGSSLLARTGAGFLAGGWRFNPRGGLCTEESNRIQHRRRIPSRLSRPWRRLLHDS